MNVSPRDDGSTVPAAGVSHAEPTASPDAPARVPLMDPKRVYAEWGEAAEIDVRDILRSHVYVKGPHVAAFEHEFASAVGAAHAVAVDSCTDALFLVLRAILAARPPDRREVILPAFTFVATAGAVVNAGGHPVFADVDRETMNLDPASVARLASQRTAAVIPVHLFGSPADMVRIREAIGQAQPGQNGDVPSDVFVFEDAAQAIGATLGGLRVGALADAAAFSFYPSKNLGAAGDGGVVTTGSELVANAVRALRDHGQTKKMYDHEHVGTNSRMDEIQAAVLRAKLPRIGSWTEERQAVGARYDAAFASSPVRAQALIDGATSAYHLYTVRAADRDAIRAHLGEAGVDTGVYYPVPLHRQTCFAPYEPAACPNADLLAEEVLSLPCFPGLTLDEQRRVIDTVLSVVGS